VSLDYEASSRTLTRFGVDLLSADGRLVFSLGHDAGELEGKGTVRLALPRLGLGDGVYEVLGTVTRPGDAPAPPHRLALSVTGGSKAGVLRPVHEWKVS
jgi:hypothetical protein